jgi:hypothetical protein
MDALIWAMAGLCLVLLGGVSGWLLLDNLRERRRARYAAALIRTYVANQRKPVAEETWPIVAQQPQVEFPRAITIPIPGRLIAHLDRQPLVSGPRHATGNTDNPAAERTVPRLLAEAAAAGDALRLAWPTHDPDDTPGPLPWQLDDELPTGVLPVIRG